MARETRRAGNSIAKNCTSVDDGLAFFDTDILYMPTTPRFRQSRTAISLISNISARTLWLFHCRSSRSITRGYTQLKVDAAIAQSKVEILAREVVIHGRRRDRRDELHRLAQISFGMR